MDKSAVVRQYAASTIGNGARHAIFAQKAHRALLDLVVRSHPVVTSAENLPKVLGVFGEIYHGSFSNATLDADIVKTVAAAAANVRQVIAGLPEKQVKKIEMILKDGGQGMGDTTDDMH